MRRAYKWVVGKQNDGKPTVSKSTGDSYNDSYYVMVHKDDANQLCEILNDLEREAGMFESMWHSESCTNSECECWGFIDEEE